MALDPVVRTYDPKQQQLSINGAIFTGFPDGTFMSVSTADSFEEREGADGTEERINKNSTGVTVEITLMKTSPTNDVLYALEKLDRLTNLGKGPFLWKDTFGTGILSSSQAYIKKKADMELGNSLGDVTWTIRCPQADFNPGSNL